MEYKVQLQTNILEVKTLINPNNNSDGTANPLNPGLEKLWRIIYQILVSTYYIPADKVAISPYHRKILMATPRKPHTESLKEN